MRNLKYLGFVLFLVWGSTANGQILISLLLGDKLNSDKLEFGLDGGLTLSKSEGSDAKEHLRTFNLGFYFEFKTKNPAWLINTGLRVKSNMGGDNLPVYSLNNTTFDSLFKDGYVTRNVGYFYVPILVKYRFKSNLYVEAGFQAGLKHSGTDVFKKKLIDEDDLTYTVKTQDNYKWLDAGLTGGVGYRLMGGKGMNVGARVYYGLVNVNANSLFPDQSNMAYYLNVGIPIGKKPEK